MKNLIFYMALLMPVFVFAQKPLVTRDMYNQWPTTAIYPQISPNSQFIAYSVTNYPRPGKYSTVLKDIKSDWERVYRQSPIEFSADSRKAVCKQGDTLHIVNLETHEEANIAGIKRFQVSSKKDWLISLKKDSVLVFRNLLTGGTSQTSQVSDYQINDAGTAVIFSKAGISGMQELNWHDLQSGRSIAFWSGKKASNFVFDIDGDKLAFVSEDMGGSKNIRIYDGGDKQTKSAIDAAMIQSDIKGQFRNLLSFNKSGNMLFFSYTKQVVGLKQDVNAAKTTIWNSRAFKLPITKTSDGAFNFQHDNNFTAVLQLQNNKIIPIDGEDDEFGYRPKWIDLDTLMLVIRHGKASDCEWNWNSEARVKVELFSLNTGKTKIIGKNLVFFNAKSYSLSPNARFVIYYEPTSKDYFSYDISSGIRRNITLGINEKWTEDFNSAERPDNRYITKRLFGWEKNDEGVILNGQHDIILADPTGHEAPYELTQGFGKRNNISFLAISSMFDVSQGASILLIGTSRVTQDRAFFSLNLSKKSKLKQLGDYQPYFFFTAIKASSSETYAIIMQSASSSPNVYLTTNFRAFKPISSIHPEKDVNWLTDERFSFRTLDGSITQGVLYKPEDFDPLKKYPVIFHYYQLADDAHLFMPPSLTYGGINIPYLVSHGYLVCALDIHCKLGYPGPSCYNTIVSAANYLSNKPFVDSKKMGLEGGSFGGYETNYIITHSHLFSAAVSESGPCDLISHYGSLFGNNVGAEILYETDQMLIGTSLWKRPDLYIQNSPIFKLDKVTTPVLLMHNKEDKNVPYAQGIEFFTGLRRNGKKAWLVEYEGEGHSLVKPVNQLDWDIKMTGFFDHYLKGAPMPDWMK